MPLCMDDGRWLIYSPAVQNTIHSDFTARIKASFLDALYAFLDGLVHLAFSEFDPLDPSMTTSHKVVGDSRITLDVQELVRRSQ